MILWTLKAIVWFKLVDYNNSIRLFYPILNAFFPAARLALSIKFGLIAL